MTTQKVIDRILQRQSSRTLEIGARVRLPDGREGSVKEISESRGTVLLDDHELTERATSELSSIRQPPVDAVIQSAIDRAYASLM